MLQGIFFLEGKGLKSMRRSGGEVVVRMVTLAMLAALGFVLMAFAQFPYPGAPWLKIEISETVTLVAYAMYGFSGGLFVAVVKTALNLAVHGPVGLGIGDLTALFTSIVFLFGIFLTSHVFRWFNKGLGFRILTYVFITLLVTVVLTALNAIFITPSYLTVYGEHPHFSTCFDEDAIQNVISYLTNNKESVSSNGWVYIGTISMFYVPFNLMKASLCCLAYEIVFNRLLFVFIRRSPKFSRYFLRTKDISNQEEQTTDDIEELEDSD